MIRQEAADKIYKWIDERRIINKGQLAHFINTLVRGDEHCSDNVPMICAFLNCDCDDCSKGKKEIAKRIVRKYYDWMDKGYPGKGAFDTAYGHFEYWLDKEEK